MAFGSVALNILIHVGHLTHKRLASPCRERKPFPYEIENIITITSIQILTTIDDLISHPQPNTRTGTQPSMVTQYPFCAHQLQIGCNYFY